MSQNVVHQGWDKPYRSLQFLNLQFWIELDFRLGNSGRLKGNLLKCGLVQCFVKPCVIQSDIEQNTSSLDPMKLNKTLLFLIEEQWWLICNRNPLPNLVQYFLVISFPRESFFQESKPRNFRKSCQSEDSTRIQPAHSNKRLVTSNTPPKLEGRLEMNREKLWNMAAFGGLCQFVVWKRCLSLKYKQENDPGVKQHEIMTYQVCVHFPYFWLLTILPPHHSSQ